MTGQVALAAPSTYGHAVPYAEFARLRREAPVSWVEEPERLRHSSAGLVRERGPGYWAVTTHAAVNTVSREPGIFSSGERGAFLVDPRTRADLEFTRQLLINMDAPQHTRIRRVVSSVFTPRAVSRLRDSIAAHAATVVADVRARGTFDAVTDLAAELPLLVLADLLGVPREDRHLFYRWSNNLVGFDDPEYGGADVDAYRRTFFEAFQYALRIADDRRNHPRDDLASRLAVAGGLTDRQFCQFWLLLIVAGNETTRHLIGGSLRALVEHRAQRDRLIAEPGLLGTAVDELVRYVSPVMQFRRTATKDVELAGAHIRAGDKVVLYYVSANRDETVFDDPDRLDLARTPNPHLAFGIGSHFCLGAHLARLELTLLLEALGPHLATLQQTGPVVRLESAFVNGAKSMPCRI
ncbi:cytochrome P450 [Micromonospora sp. FIMYZ51]|uniref:cytochrome P450 n=1 Tax=Micromonospora sp. FIMYZ51 TaxID=3051832 RepID=UPI00312028EC